MPALRTGQDAEISRTTPLFRQPGESAGQPLADPYVSRRPIVLSRADRGGIQIGADPAGSAVLVDGRPLTCDLEVDKAALERGVVLQIADRVVLVLHELAPDAGPPGSSELVGESAALVRLRWDIHAVADLDVPVLIRGESGVGKELVARALHLASHRRSRPCICVNMAAIPSSVAASELFGHTRGAFSGAAGGPGYFGRADRGTLLLDEIGDAPLDVQAMLLRALETGEIQPVGAPAPRRVDVRLLAATDADLDEAVRAGRFRGPLLHRLAGYEIQVPPLRERRDDIGRLLLHFVTLELRAVGQAHHLEPPDPDAEPWLPASVVAELVRYDWPGNVRQLRNVMRQLVVSNRYRPFVAIDRSVRRLLSAETPRGADEPRPPRRRKPSELAKDEIVEVLRRHRWEVRPAAAELGIARNSLYGLMKGLGLARKAGELGREEIVAAWQETGGDLDRMSDRLEVSKRGLQMRMKALDFG